MYIPTKQLEIARQIENFSAFVQICIDQAPDIMAWAILNKSDPKKYHARKKLEDVIEDFNEEFPMDPDNPLTKINKERQGTWQTSSPKIPDVLY